MILALPVLLDLAHACAPAVAPETLLSLVRAESGFDPLVIGVNDSPRRTFHPQTAAAAATLAARLINQGLSVDLGLGQLNSRNLGPLRLSVADAFDPCRNLAASGEVLRAAYSRAAPADGDPQQGLSAAFSLYNTGDATRGFRNGYVARVTHAAAQVVPAIRLAAPAAAATPPPDPHPSAEPPPVDVFARPDARAALVF